MSTLTIYSEQTFASRLKATGIFLKSYRKLAINPENTEHVVTMVDSLHDMGLFKFAIRKLRANSLTAKALDSRHQFPRFDVDELLKLPKGSLGHSLGAQLKEFGFDPNYFRTRKADDDGTYIMVHMSEVHDLWHMALGFTTSYPHEIGVQAFMLRQLRTPQSVVIVGGGILRCLLRDQALLKPTLKAIGEGWRLAGLYPPLFGIDWMKFMSEPLLQLQARFRVGERP